MQLEYLSEVKKILHNKPYKVVGTDVKRLDGPEKVTGMSKYAADQFLKDALVLRVVRSPHAHAIVKNVDKGSALRINGVKGVLTAEDVPGRNVVVYMLPDQPLITPKARHIGDIVAVIVAENEEAALQGADALKVDYEVLTPVFDPKESLKGKVKIHEEEGNIAGVVKIRKGDVDKAFKKCDVVIENTYRAGSQDHGYLEPEAAMAIPNGHNGVTVIGTTQNPFRTRDCVAEILGVDSSHVTIITPFLGGGFGGKDAYGPIICGLPALAALKFGRPAAILYTRFESQAYRYKRSPFDIKYKTGATKDGKIQAVEADYIVEGGAYSTQTLGLMKRAAYHGTGVYEVPNVKIDGRTVYTNNIPNSAFNGFGNPQMLFAAENQIELIAEKLNMDPLEIRLKNALVPGSKTGTSQLLDHSVGIKDLIEKVAAQSGYEAKRAKYAKAPKTSVKRRGIGLGCSWHACGTTGFRRDWAGASVIMSNDGSITYASGIVELGQATLTSHAMMVAEILGIPLEWVKVGAPDTSKMPDSGETHAQRGTIIGGTAACDAALKLRKTLNKVASEMLACKEEEITIEGGQAFNTTKPAKKIQFKSLAFEVYMRGYSPAEYGFIVAKRGYPDVETGQGEPYAAYTFGCTVAEVEVDMETGEVDVLKLVPGVAAGKIVQPDITRGQVNGCGLMGMGYALTEAVPKKDGRVLNPSFTDYLIPTMKDMPEMVDYIKVEDEYKYSGFGVKGVGEIALIATPIAIANAVHNATGIRFQEIPLNMEKVYFAIKEKEKSSRGGRS